MDSASTPLQRTKSQNWIFQVQEAGAPGASFLGFPVNCPWTNSRINLFTVFKAYSKHIKASTYLVQKFHQKPDFFGQGSSIGLLKVPAT
jgi:hypothetical protein